MAGVSSASRGREETEILKANIQAQISRLVMQLSDLEEFKDDVADDEFYAETRADTLAQLEEFKAQMTKMSEGDMSLVDEVGDEWEHGVTGWLAGVASTHLQPAARPCTRPVVEKL